MRRADPTAPGASAHSGRRPDVDGLRALAITLVVLFHAGFTTVPGGFVGVDVFFVISGYLITAITRTEAERGDFSLAIFYERRIRRIVPALAVVLIVTGVASLFVILPEDLRLLAKGMFAAPVFVSNALFAHLAADYFDADNLTLQPLLHTWSLGVEAQFYLLYPLVLVAFRRRPGALLLALAILAAASFALGAWGAVHRPVDTFYLLPGRAWELLLGALLTFAPPPKRRGVSELSVVAGLAAVVLAGAVDTAATAFPGWPALLPCCGAALVIRGGGGVVSGWLGARPFAWLGRISYSLYLWHWPVLVLARYGHGPDLPLGMRLALIAGTVALSAATYTFVERPFITRRALPRRRSLLVCVAVATLAALGLGEALDLAGRGVLPLVRLPPNVLALAAGSFDRLEGECPVPQADARPYPCRFGAAGRAPTILLWGNSYARMWVPALAGDADRHDVAGLAFIFSKCPPLVGDERPGLPGCAAFNRAAIAYVRSHREIRTVVLGADWFDVDGGQGRLAATVEALEEAGVAVAIVMAPPQADFSVPRTLAIAALRGEPAPAPIDETVARDRQRDSRDLIARLAEERGIAVIDPFTALCDGTACPLTRDGRPVFYDAGHLTVSAARAVHGLFDPIFAAPARLR